MAELTKYSDPTEIKEEWVRRLESGDYDQIEGWLGKKMPDGTEGFCCLGVLTEMACEAGLVRRMESGHDYGHYRYHSDELIPDTAQLPKIVSRWAGLSTHDPITSARLEAEDRDDFEGYLYSLSGLNDSGRGFPEIADQIRKDFL